MRVGVRDELRALAGEFRISRGGRRYAHLLVVRLEHQGRTGRGECAPYPRYGESIAKARADIERVVLELGEELTRSRLPQVLPACAARNALDCALWDLEAKLSGVAVVERLGLDRRSSWLSARTISINSPEQMAQEAAALADAPLLKIKLDTQQSVERLQAVRQARPDARLIVDANESWDLRLLERLFPALTDAGVELVEQPLPAGQDGALTGLDAPVALCADESCHTVDELSALDGRYSLINIKLEKTGGLSAALTLSDAARRRGLGIMVGCTLTSSLGIAPALCLCAYAQASYCDLDGPLWLREDLPNGLVYAGNRVQLASAGLWG